MIRNESDVLSSQLILEAEHLAWAKWPGERLYTYVDPKKVKTCLPFFRKPNPGKCFIKAGWTRMETVNEKGKTVWLTTQSGKVILEKLPCIERKMR